MPYTLKAKQLVDVSHECKTLDDAHAKAMELQGTGHIDFKILDPSGQDVTDTDEAGDFNDKN